MKTKFAVMFGMALMLGAAPVMAQSGGAGGGAGGGGGKAGGNAASGTGTINPGLGTSPAAPANETATMSNGTRMSGPSTTPGTTGSTAGSSTTTGTGGTAGPAPAKRPGG